VLYSASSAIYCEIGTSSGAVPQAGLYDLGLRTVTEKARYGEKGVDLNEEIQYFLGNGGSLGLTKPCAVAWMARTGRRLEFVVCLRLSACDSATHLPASRGRRRGGYSLVPIILQTCPDWSLPMRSVAHPVIF
jgi:hypothetical protein